MDEKIKQQDERTRTLVVSSKKLHRLGLKWKACDVAGTGNLGLSLKNILYFFACPFRFRVPKPFGCWCSLQQQTRREHSTRRWKNRYVFVRRWVQSPWYGTLLKISIGFFLDTHHVFLERTKKQERQQNTGSQRKTKKASSSNNIPSKQQSDRHGPGTPFTLECAGFVILQPQKGERCEISLSSSMGSNPATRTL